MKRILFLVPRMNIGGAETYVYTAAKELRARGYEVFLASGGGRLADELKTAGIRTFFVPIRQSRILSVWRVSSIVKKYHIDIIHANSGAAGIIAARVKRNTSVPVVYTAHGILGNMEKEYVIDQLDQIICVSEYVRQDSMRIISLSVTAASTRNVSPQMKRSGSGCEKNSVSIKTPSFLPSYPA